MGALELASQGQLGGGGDHCFDARGWLEVADQHHQRDLQSEASGMDELDTSCQLTSTCKPNPSAGWDVTLNRPAGLCGHIPRRHTCSH